MKKHFPLAQGISCHLISLHPISVRCVCARACVCQWAAELNFHFDSELRSDWCQVIIYLHLRIRLFKDAEDRNKPSQHRFD